MKPLRKINLAFNGSSLNSPFQGGWSRYTSELIYHLKERYSDHLEITVFKNLTQQPHSLWEQFSLPNLCHTNNIDILHAPANGGLPVLGSFHKILTVHDLFSENDFKLGSHLKSFSSLKSALRYKTDWHLSLNAADLIITISEFSKNELIKYGIKKEIFPIYEGANSLFKETKTPYRHSRPYLLYVGSFDSRKKTDLLISEFLKTPHEIDLILIGKDAHKKMDLYSSDRIIFLENINDSQLAEYYHGALAFITYSQTEGFGLPLVEAMSAGKPILYRGSGAIPEIVGPGGIYIDSLGLSASLDKLIKSSDFLAEVSREALKQSEKFDWSKTAQETYEIYLGLFNSRIKSLTTSS